MSQPVVNGANSISSDGFSVRQPRDLIRNIFGGGHGILFNKAGEIAECLILSVLRPTPREPPSNRCVERTSEPGIGRRDEITGVVRKPAACIPGEGRRPCNVY